MDDASSAPTAAGFTIFRRDEAPHHQPSQATGITEVSGQGFQRLVEAGLGQGAESKVLFSAPGFNLLHVWFKSGFPLFRHSHGPDCLYQVVGGQIQVGDQVLKKGDGFFVPAGTHYTYIVGPEGCEVLEFRNEPLRDTDIQANNPVFWEKALEMVLAKQEQWKTEPRPL
jgi:redox-sensitive bicupin YhaK (pirin superfamily)